MNINVERFLALTALLAAPLVAAPACVINTSDDDTDGNSTNNEDGTGTSPTSSPTTTTPTSTTEPTGTTEPTTVDDSGTDAGTGTDGTGDTTADPDTGTTGADLGNCCVPDGSVGCEITEVADCVCAEDPFCCEEGWDETCAGEVNTLGCGTCELPPMVWDCYCVATCDGADYLDPFQACGGTDLEAADNGLAACEADLGAACGEHTCDSCECFTAEAPAIEC